MRRYWNLWTLCLLCFLLLEVSTEAKKINPQLFGTLAFQRPLAVSTALALSLGIFLSLKVIFERTTKPLRAILPFAVFLSIYLLMLAAYLMGMIALPKVRAVVYNEYDARILALLLTKLYNEKHPGKQGGYASLIYRQHGVAVPLPATDGGFVTYQHTPDDAQSWAGHQKTTRQLTETVKQMDWQSEDFQALSIIYLSSLSSVFFLGGFIVAVRKPKIQAPALVPA